MAARRLRLDMLLVEKGLFPTRSKAQAAVMAGQVLVDGEPQAKAGALIKEDAALSLAAQACPFVSRGGLKLAAALDAFPVRVQGKVCLDAGASTGGFTDCLLQRGASKVYAVDVGYAQLDLKLRNDPRVVWRESFDARKLEPRLFDPRPRLGVIDVSFISVTRVLPSVIACLEAPFEILALVKPQFEVGPKLAPKGVVREEIHRLAAVELVRKSLADLPVRELGLLECPVHGPKGNVEYFLYLGSA